MSDYSVADNSMPTVFVTNGQERQALAAIRSLGRSGFTVVCGESTRFATSFASKYVDERVVYPSPDREPEAFVSFMEEYLIDHDIDVLLPTANRSTQSRLPHDARPLCARRERHISVRLPNEHPV